MRFMEQFDPVQVRYGGLEFRKLVEAIVKTAQASANVRTLQKWFFTPDFNFSKPSVAIIPVRSAILRLDPSGSSLTSTHLLFVRICLEARAYTQALPVIDNDIFHFAWASDKGVAPLNWRFLCSQHETSSAIFTKSSGLSSNLDYRDHLQYFLLSAMIYMVLKNWARALLFLEIVIITPTHNFVSMIQVEAFKKWILVSLLLKGHVRTASTLGIFCQMI